MKFALFIIISSYLSAKTIYPVDSLLKSDKISFLKKISIAPVSAWQRISYNTNMLNCQFYPSCSNYGAQALRQYGFIKGSIIASDRITRCNPFAMNYHLDLQYPFNEKDGRLIDSINQKNIIQSSKSPLTAALLSTILPGLGRAYSGRYWDGIMGFWSVYIAYSSAYFSIKNNKKIASPFMGITFTFIYFGEIYGAWRTAKYYQKSSLKN